MKRLLIEILRILHDPFGFWNRVKIPSLPKGFRPQSQDYASLMDTHRNELLQAMRDGIFEKSQMHNDAVTHFRTTKLNLFIAGGALLGVVLSFSYTSQTPLVGAQYLSAWLLFISVVVGPISELLTWSYESRRAEQAMHNETLAWMLVLRGGHDEYAKQLLRRNVDDLEQIPVGIFWFLFINGIASSLSIVAFAIGTIVLFLSILQIQSVTH